MSQLSVLNNLGRRLFLASGAVAVILLLMMAAGIQALSAHQAYSRFAVLVTRAFDAAVHLEVELGRSLTRQTPSDDAAPAERSS